MSYTGKKKWSEKEDKELLEIVYGEFGESTNQWAEIGKIMTTRSGKQCRERFHNHLRADIKHGAWTKEEDDLLWELQLKHPGQWALISKNLEGRSASSVKNRWHMVCRKLKTYPETHTGVPSLKPSLPLSRASSPEGSVDSFDPLSDESLSDSNDEREIFGMTEEEEREWLDFLVDLSSPVTFVEEAAAASEKDDVGPPPPPRPPHLVNYPAKSLSKSLCSNIEGMESLSINCATANVNEKDTPISPSRLETLLRSSPMNLHHRPPPCMQKKRACHIRTPKLSSHTHTHDLF